MHRTTIAKYTKFSAAELQKSVTDPLSCVAAIQSNEILSLRPRDCEHIVKGVQRCVTDKIGRFHMKVNGIVLGYAKIRVENTLPAIRLDSPFLHVRATVDYYVFQPCLGSTLRGTVNYVSKGFVSAMIYRVFSVTVKLGVIANKKNTIEKGSQIAFIVKSCDMKSEIPVIEGELVSDEIVPIKKQVTAESDGVIEECIEEELSSTKKEKNMNMKKKASVLSKKITTENGDDNEDCIEDVLPFIKKEMDTTKKDSVLPQKSRNDMKQNGLQNGNKNVSIAIKKERVSSESDSFSENYQEKESSSPQLEASDSDNEKNELIDSLLGDLFSGKHNKKRKNKRKKSDNPMETISIKQENTSMDEDFQVTPGKNSTKLSKVAKKILQSPSPMRNGSSFASVSESSPALKKRNISFNLDLNQTVYIEPINLEPKIKKKKKI
ncbi:probable DNA-directed RNA polymerase I subunit RPA43 [Anopheles nili]|uniref:probable DNA-directed RNA polymerase I subunit RPA43 n=1 Tax=Anopheles nili TaxID=185578 RepID=UPI00237AB414|nr:probable DNA-directed RNA polymerase I subunit RPA43 [Anopheles nili]